MNSSVVASSLLRQSMANLPDSWYDPETAMPTRLAREELTWSLVFHTLQHLMFSAPLPPNIQPGRERVRFPVGEADWNSFAEELGLQEEHIRQRLSGHAAGILRREPLPTEAGLPALALGLLLLLEGFSRHKRGRQRASPAYGMLGFDDGAPASQQACGLVDGLIAWAGGEPGAVKDRYRVPFHVVWLPLTQQSRKETAVAQPPPQNLALPRDFLQQARMSASAEAEPTPEPGSLHAYAPTRETQPAQAKPDRCDSASRAMLCILLEPLLGLSGDPRAMIEEAEKTGNDLAKDMLRTWRRVLLPDNLRLYGEPGSTIELTLPDSAWQLAKLPFGPRLHNGSGRYRVLRRGALLGGEVLVPGLVIREPHSSSDRR